jgi:MOSC domain-containing protein YiiM
MLTTPERPIRHLSMAELTAGLDHIRAAPKEEGRLLAIVSRPGHGQRNDVQTCAISFKDGVEGDHWSKGCWKSLPDGSPDPDVQICIMSARCIDLIAQDRSNWPPAGDNLFIDMNLTPENMPPGMRLAIGTAVIEITPVAHNGCDGFIARYGRDACVFVNTGVGKRMRLRGIYARVVKDGRISAGDAVVKAG